MKLVRLHINILAVIGLLLLCWVSFADATNPYILGIRTASTSSYDDIKDNGDSGTSYSGSAWSSSSYISGYYGSGYLYHAVDSSSDYYQYQWTGLASGTYDVYEWHPAYSGYSDATPFEILDDSTSRGTPTVDQTANGGAWNLVGSYSITSGTCNIRIKTNPATGSNVIADAIRIVLQ